MMKKHIGYDDGILNQAVEEVTGIPAQFYQQTTKTRCGKRIRLARIDNDSPTCPLCIKDRDEELARHKSLKPLIQKLMDEGGCP